MKEELIKRIEQLNSNLEAILAYEAGRPIQFKTEQLEWIDVETPCFPETLTYRAKPQPREWFFNEYKAGFEGAAYESEEIAKRQKAAGYIRTVKFVEVME